MVLFSSGYWGGQESTFFLATAWFVLSLLGAFSGGVLTFLVGGSETESLAGRRRWIVVRSLRVLLPTLGLMFSIIGITVSLFCSPVGCATKPFYSEGIVLLAVGIPIFLGGMVLLASTVGNPSSGLAREPPRP